MIPWTLVTGGGQGLGAVICKTLAQQGHNIVVHYNTSAKEAAKVVKDCRKYGVEAELIQGDFSTPRSTQKFIKQFLDQFSAAHILINNAGDYINKPLLETTQEEWLKLYQVNFHAPMALMTALAPGIKKSEGSIVNIGVSGLHTMQANVVNTAYGATKLSLWLATKALSRELAPFQVRVNMVSPGQLENSVDRPTDPSRLPMRRLGKKLEVAKAIAFLLSDDSAYITGQNLDISGAI